MAGRYWSRVHKEAWRRTRENIGATVLSILAPLLSAGVVFKGLSIFGSPGAVEDELIAKIGTAAAAILVAILVYLYWIVGVPSDWDKTKTEEIDKLKEAAHSRLELRFDKSDTRCLLRVQGSPIDSSNPRMYVHALAINKSPFSMDDCHVDCDRIDAVDFSGNPIKTDWRTPLPLSWARRPKGAPDKYSPIMLPPDSENLAGVISAYTGAESEGVDLFRVEVEDGHDAVRWFRQPGIYTLHLNLSSTQSTSAHLKLTVKWTGKVSETEVE